ncbi:helix-turn-helix domain-containing protein [Cereibacter sphaeroides]|uniref:helix-turn-helix domain-containing protein n=1 Tax=Cereibacter sphaeroides TaxID=1063 RepID=UPI0002A42997|nr:putative transcriptional regulator [Rhodobacter sp. AKP1]
MMDEEGAALPVWSRRLQELTERSGLSQAELARRAGMSRDTYNRYCRGLTRPPRKKVLALAELFGVETWEIDPLEAGIAALRRESERSLEALGEQPTPSTPSYILSPPSSGDPRRMHLRVDADVRIETALRIAELLNREGSS